MGRWFRALGRSAGPLVVAATAAALWAGGAQAGSPRLIECQRPMITGEEVYSLKNVSSKTACPVVISLGRWENIEGNIRKLYTCTGPHKFTPVLVLQTFDGWRMAITKAGFRMSRGTSSFGVTGTDFPVICD